MPRLRPEYTQAIWAMTEALQDEKQMESGLSSCLTIMTETLGCENGFAWIINHADERLYLIACAGEKDVTGISISKGQGITGSVYESGEGVVVSDCSKDERFSSSVDEETGFLTNSMICVPLRTKNAIYGCIQLLNKTDGLFTEEDLHLSENLAALAAIDIEDKGYVVRLTEKKEPIISLRKVTKEYPSGEGVLKVLKGIDLDIYEGEFLVVLGESGCGKSTMLNIIGGMDALTNGQISIDGKDFSHPSEEDLTHYRRDYIGFIFQSYQLMPNLNALENVEFIAEISKEPISSEKALSLVGLSERAGNFPSQMSGGQQQRVSIARALVKNPRVILADEPTAALDFQTGQEVLMIVEDIVRNQHKTVVMITHNAEIGKMADRVVKLKGGLVSSIRVNMHPLKAEEISW